MNDKTLFSEQQKLQQPWLWIVLLVSLSIPLGIFSNAIIRQVVRGIPFGNAPVNNTILIGIFIFFVLFSVMLIILFLRIKLYTDITFESINVKFSPLQRKYRRYFWEDIVSAEVKKCSVWEGWGYRNNSGFGLKIGFNGIHLNSLTKKIILYRVAGKHALYLHLKNGKKVIIGTTNTYEIEKTLKKIEQIKKENQLNIM